MMGMAPRRRGFVLMEVMVSVAILGIAVAAVMRSFVISLEAARRAEIINTGSLLAQNLLEEIQISPPPEGEYRGTFAPENPDYEFVLTVKHEEVNYTGVRRVRGKREFRPLEMARLVVTYEDDRRRMRVIELDSAIMGLQKFSNLALKEYRLFELY